MSEQVKKFVVKSQTIPGDFVVAPRGHYFTPDGVKKEQGRVTGCVEWSRTFPAYVFRSHRAAARCAIGCNGVVVEIN